jgi:rare lipoprotein A
LAVKPGDRRAGLFAAVAGLVTLPLGGPVLAEDVAIADSAPAVIQAAPEVPAEEEEKPRFDPIGAGEASYYADRFAGQSTASGEPYDPAELTAAHRSLPFGSRVLVTNEQTGRSVVVTINDRGPFHRGRVIDLSRAAARRIGIVQQGSGAVNLSLLPR